MRVKVAAEVGVGQVVLKSMVEVYGISKYVISLLCILYFGKIIKQIYSN